MKAFLVSRVSTDEQKDALPAQSYRLTEYARSRGYDYELTEISESAYKDNRAIFSLLVNRIASLDEKSIVVFDKIDRYTRDSTSEEVRALDKLRKAGKVELHFPSDNLFIHKDSPATDLLRLGMGVVVAQYYSDSVSDNVKRRFEQKLRDGEWIGKAPIGYKNTIISGGKRWVEIDDYYAQAVRDAFELYAAGTQSLRTIAKRWQSEYGLKVGSSKIDQVLNNPFYYGEMRVKGKLYPHKYTPIISEDLFKRVDDVRKGFNTQPHRWAGLPFTLRGLMACAVCGCRITFETKKGKYTYGHCTQSKYKHSIKYVNENVILTQVQKILENIQIPENIFGEISSVLRASHEAKKDAQVATLASIQTEIDKYQKRIERVYDDYLDEKIDEAFYNRKFAEFREKQKILQYRRENLELVDDEYYATVSHLLKLAKDAPILFEKADIQQKRKMIKTVLSNFTLDGDQLGWKYKKPFDTMAFCAENSNWLRRLDSNQRPRS